MTFARVSSSDDLFDALATAEEIEVDGTLTGLPMITLRPGVSLRGGTLRFGRGGIRLSSGNRLEDVRVIVPDTEVAVSNDTSVPDLGRLLLHNVSTRGQVLLVTDGAIRGGRVEVDGLSVLSADTLGRQVRQHGLGAEVVQGAFTLWNQQPDPAVRVTATLNGIAAGSAGSPVRGSGVLIAGQIDSDLLRTGPVFADGGVGEAGPDLVGGGVFVVSGAEIGTVVNDGPVSTVGRGDLVLGNWGTVGTWTARGPITAHGPVGTGFVSSGVLSSARVHSITTHGDGTMGIEVSTELPLLEVTGDVTTLGGRGTSQVRGKQVSVHAIAISVRRSGRIGRLFVGGSVSTHSDNAVTLDVAGSIDELEVLQGIMARGSGSEGVRLVGTVGGLDNVTVTAPRGRAIVRGHEALAERE